VRGAPAIIEQAGVAQDEGAAAHAQHARTPVDRPVQRLEQVLGKTAGGTRIASQSYPRVADRGQGDQVGLLQPLQAVTGAMAKSSVRSGGVGVFGGAVGLTIGLCSSGCARRAVLVGLCSSGCARRAVLVGLCSSGCARRAGRIRTGGLRDPNAAR
jgi:hypothetical protein